MEQEDEEVGDGQPTASRPRRQLLQPLSRPISSISREPENAEVRSRSPHTFGRRVAEMGAQETHAQTISKLIDAELGRYLAPAVLKDIRKQSLELSNKIRGLQRTNMKREKLKKDLSVFSEGRLPEGYRPFPHTFETHLLDEMVHQAGITKTVDQSLSVRETKHRFHVEHLKTQCELDLQLLDKHRAHLKSYIRKEEFVDRCLQHFPTHPAQDSAAAVLDLEESDTEEQQSLHVRGLSQDQCTARVLAIYRKIIDTEAEHKRLEEDKKIAERRKHEEVVRQVVNKSPEQFLNDTIDSRIAMSKATPKPKMKTRKKQNDRGALQVHVDDTGLAVQALSGMMDQSIVSDYVAVRPNESKGTKGFGKTNNSKGSGKGKGKSSSSSKGKGKGKGRGKNKGPQPTDRPLPKNEFAPRKGGKGKSKGKGVQQQKGKGKGKKENGKDSWLGSSRGRWQWNIRGFPDVLLLYFGL